MPQSCEHRFRKWYSRQRQALSLLPTLTLPALGLLVQAQSSLRPNYYPSASHLLARRTRRPVHPSRPAIQHQTHPGSLHDASKIVSSRNVALGAPRLKAVEAAQAGPVSLSLHLNPALPISNPPQVLPLTRLQVGHHTRPPTPLIRTTPTPGQPLPQPLPLARPHALLLAALLWLRFDTRPSVLHFQIFPLPPHLLLLAIKAIIRTEVVVVIILLKLHHYRFTSFIPAHRHLPRGHRLCSHHPRNRLLPHLHHPTERLRCQSAMLPSLVSLRVVDLMRLCLAKRYKGPALTPLL